jgi:hypothetical protein
LSLKRAAALGNHHLDRTADELAKPVFQIHLTSHLLGERQR